MMEAWVFYGLTFNEFIDDIRFIAIHTNVSTLSILDLGRIRIMMLCEIREQITLKLDRYFRTIFIISQHDLTLGGLYEIVSLNRALLNSIRLSIRPQIVW